MVSAQNPVDEFTLIPHGDQSFSLGYFTPSAMPRGFAVEILSDDEHPVESEITTGGSPGHREFLLHVINHTEDSIQARVALI